MFRTVQSVCPRGRTRRTTGGSPSFFESMDGLWEMELGPNVLWGPVGPCEFFAFRSLLLYIYKVQVNDFISLMIYERYCPQYMIPMTSRFSPFSHTEAVQEDRGSAYFPYYLELQELE